MWRDKNHRFWTFQNHGRWQLQLSWWHGADIAGGWYLLVSNAWGTCKLRSRTVYKKLWKCVSSVCAAISLTHWRFETLASAFVVTRLFLRLAAFYCSAGQCLKTSSYSKGWWKAAYAAEIASSGVGLGCSFTIQSGSVLHLKQELGKYCTYLEIQVHQGDKKSIPLKLGGEHP